VKYGMNQVSASEETFTFMHDMLNTIGLSVPFGDWNGENSLSTEAHIPNDATGCFLLAVGMMFRNLTDDNPYSTGLELFLHKNLLEKFRSDKRLSVVDALIFVGLLAEKYMIVKPGLDSLLNIPDMLIVMPRLCRFDK
jgi:hypothetical protein